MNALYVTVSIPLLLLLAGFNHAHGLTTFGKTSSNTNQQPPQPPDLCLFYRLAKPCSNHTVCKGILGASCVQDPKDHSRKGCLCGDNQPPVNGACSATYRGPNHLCSENKECVEGALCLELGKSHSGPSADKVCKCLEGRTESHNMCSGGTPTSVLSGLLILLAITRTILY